MLPVEVSLPSGEVEAEAPLSLTAYDIQPRRSSAVYEEFGVEVSRPKVLYGRIDDATRYQVHGRVEYLGVVYAIAAEPLVFDSIAAMAHVKVLLEQMV
jgi:hypothetical protein